MSHLIASPELYGDPFQAYFNGSGPGAPPVASLLDEFRRDPAIGQVTLMTSAQLSVNQADVRALAVSAARGPLLLSSVAGRLPAAVGEIALGPSTMRTVGVSLGGTVTVTVPGLDDGRPRRARFRVVGVLAFPGEFATGGLGTGAALTTAAFLAAQCPPPGGHRAASAEPAGSASSAATSDCQRQAQARPPDAIVVRAVPGPAGRTALARHLSRHQDNYTIPSVPSDLVSFGEAANFPLLLGIIVALCGAATLLHLLIVSVARRRAEGALLAALGFLRRQLAAVVCWQSVTVAVAGTAVGVPLGIAVGRAIWRAFAIYVGVVPVPVLPGGLIAALAAGGVAAALVIAAVPALLAARPRPARILRAE
jgi:hypothetical protein